jgi:hypothetical protein
VTDVKWSCVYQEGALGISPSTRETENVAVTAPNPTSFAAQLRLPEGEHLDRRGRCRDCTNRPARGEMTFSIPQTTGAEAGVSNAYATGRDNRFRRNHFPDTSPRRQARSTFRSAARHAHLTPQLDFPQTSTS